MNDEMISITISLKKETVNKLEKIVNYYNQYTKFNNKKWDYTSMEDIIKGSVIRQIEIIENYNNFIENDNLEKPFQIKNRFREIMLDQGLKQKDLVNMTGLDKSNISTIISNKNQPSLDNFLRMWIALRCPPIHEVLYRE